MDYDCVSGFFKESITDKIEIESPMQVLFEEFLSYILRYVICF